MDSSMEVNLAEKKFSDQSKSTIGSTSTISSTQTASDLNGKTKPEDQAAGNGHRKPIDVDALLKKLEEDDKILKELEELEKKERLPKKKPSTTITASTIETSHEIATNTPKTSVNTTPLPSSTLVTTASKSTSTEKESHSSTPPPTLNTITTRSVSTSTTSTNTSSTVTDQVSTISELNTIPLNRIGSLALTSYGGGANLSSSMPSLIDTQQALQLISSQLNSRPSGSSISPQELDKLMEKLEQDNRILAELDQKVKRISSSNVSSPVFLSSSLPTLTGIAHPGLLPTLYSQLFSGAISDRNMLDKRLMLSANAYFDEEIDHIQLLQALIKNQELQYAEDLADYIELPNRGRCRVFIARYSYDPYKQSPNENPESELHLAAGDFILVFGDVDDDGFYFGELLDGRRGLVPSNFVEKLTGEDLFEFQTSILYEGRDGDESTCSYPPEFYDAILDDVMAHSNFQHLIAPEDFHRMNDYIELVESSEIDEEDLSDPERAQANAAKDTIPPPKRLILERQLHKSILLSWLPPDCPKSYIDNYQIYVDGVLKVTIPSIERTRALVEGVDSSIPHRISVRAIAPQGRASRDAACTIVIGKNVPFAPCSVKATSITATSALISWLPSNSNFYHVVAVNSVEVKTVGPSTYKHLITGLSPNTMYRVSVRAKPGKLLCSEEKNPKKLEMLTTFVDFRTQPKSLPEPPVDVQIESGPQDGTLLVTWLPVTLDQFGTSNGCAVTGYAVFSAHKKLAEIDSPTGDHALLDISQVESFHKKAVTVRTKSGENLSQDSIACQIPDELIKFNAPRKSIDNNYFHGQLRMRIEPVQKSHSDSESETEINQLMNNVTRRSQVFDPVQLQSQSGSPAMRGHIQNRGQPRMQPSSQQMQMQSHLQPQQQQQTQQQQQQHHQQQQQFRQQPSHQQRNLSNHPNQNQFSNQHNQVNRNMNVNQPHSQQQQQLPHNQIQSNFQNTPGNLNNQSNIPSIDMNDPKKALQGGNNRIGGSSPQPPQRNRQYTDHERSHFGQGRGAIAGGQPRVVPNRQQRDVRYFVALYDYDPLTMSPNPDAANEELPFREGDIIKIFGDKDPDGFYRGELNDRIGFVPCNMVSEVQYDAETGAPIRGQNDNDPWAHLHVKKMIALYDYDPQELSPNPDAEMELAFHAGDHIYVFGDLDEDGFYMGELNGNRGLVPSNFLTDAIDGTTRHATPNQINRGPVGDSRTSQTQQNQLQGQTGYQTHPSINQQQLQNQQPGYSQQHQPQQHQHQQHPHQQQPQHQLAHQQHQSQGQGYGQHQFHGQPQQATSSNQKVLTNVIGQGMRPQGSYGAQLTHQQHPGHHQQTGPQQRPNSLELRLNQGVQGHVNQISQQQQHHQQQHQQHQQHQQQLLKNQQQQYQHLPQQQQTNNLNPISNLLNSGKKMLEEATTPRVSHPPSFDGHGQMMQQHEQNHVNMNQQGINRPGLNQQQSQAQLQYQQGQQNYGQRQFSQQQQLQQQNQQQTMNNRQQFGYGNNVPGMGLAQGQQQNQNQQQPQQGPTLSGALGAVKSIFKI
ncbi:RIMS-binding protein 2-like isoform X3 [Tetranychus urticae]|uniref:RIMS-binding protein 2-like isoform X3 n=1 Tax=Tetranychus urticae TaxID=32264 RepID=UPI00077BAED6|nr:RIMS-binding protein 2-like isoform X3 [Tetranychus urticae]